MDQLESVSDHLEACADCNQLVEELDSSSDQLVNQLRVPLPELEYGGELPLQQALDRMRSLRPADRPVAPEGLERKPLLPPNSRLGAYLIADELGHGGMGSIYKAIHTQLEKPVALKVLQESRAGDAASMARFRREMVVLGRLEHPNLVCAYDAGQQEGLLYLVMQLVDGLDLSQVVRRLGPLVIPDACEIVRHAAAGLQYAHERRIVHRDIKPSNLMLSTDGVVKVLDLGLARLVDQSHGEDLTNSGLVLGTLDYMAPEQAGRGGEAGFSADVYSLGATLYKLLTGRAPFAAPEYDTALKKVIAVSNVPATPIGELRPEIPAGLAAAIMRMLAKDPAARFQTTGELVEILAPYAEGSDLKALCARALDADALDNKQDSRPAPLVQTHMIQSARTDPDPTGRPRAQSDGDSRDRRPVLAIAALYSVIAIAIGAFAVSQVPVRHSPDDTGREELAHQNGASATAGALAVEDVEDAAKRPAVSRVAVLPFADRNKDLELGHKVSDLVFAQLATANGIYLVEREQLGEVLSEQELNLSGAVQPETAIQIGRLTGAEILVTGAVSQIETTIFLTAKIISTETGEVIPESVKGTADEDRAQLAERLAAQIASRLESDAGRLVPARPTKSERIARLKRQLADLRKPTLWIRISERHVGQPTIDPAAETELIRFARGAGFEVVDHQEGNSKQADVVIDGEAFSELATRYGNLISVKAHVEMKAVDRRSGKVIAAEQQTAIAVDLAEQNAGKTALQDAAAAIAQRLLPRLANGE
jgi:serine/threonine protein kinase/TolB-like protein